MKTQIPSVPFMFTTPLVLIFPNVFEAKAFKDNPNGDKTFTCSFGIRADVPELPQFGDAVQAAAVAGNLDPSIVAIKWPYLSGEAEAARIEQTARLQGKTRDVAAYRQFAYILKTKSGEGNPPGVAVELPGRGLVDMTPQNMGEIKRLVYGGALAMVKINLRASIVPSGPLAGNYVSAYLQNIAVVNDATTGQPAPRIEAFSGGGAQASSAVFGAHVKGRVTNVSPTGGLPGGTVHPFAPGGIGNPGPQNFGR